MILYNQPLADTETDNHFLPVVHLADGTDLLAYLDSHTGVEASFSAPASQDGQGDVMASFSSRGPAGLYVKPDITAPGVQILAGNTPTPDEVAGGPPGEYFQAIAGTSMSSPHIAGSALLLKSLHQDWTPGQVKSAIMTTAKTSVVKEDTVTPADPFDMGSGRVRVDVAANPGLTISDTAANMVALGGDPITAVHVNIPSIDAPTMPGRVTTTRVVKNVGAGTAIYNVTATAPAGSAIAVEPSLFTIAAGATRSLQVTITSQPGVEGQQFGEVDLNAAGRVPLHLPVAWVPTQGDVSLTSHCTPTDIEVDLPSTCTVSASNNSFNPTTVDINSTVDSHLTVTGADGLATHDASSASLHGVNLAGRQPGVPSLGTFGPLGSGYIPLDIPQIDATPQPIGDEQALTFTGLPPFIYNGVTYDQLSAVSNGYIVVGPPHGSQDIEYVPQSMPDVALPNNVLAPLWGDLTGTGANNPDGILASLVSFGPGFDYIVIEFRVNAFGTTNLKDFEVFLGINGTQDISFNYAPGTDVSGLTVGEGATGVAIGAENEPGTGGAELAHDTNPPSDLTVTSTDPVPGDTATMTMHVRGEAVGTGLVHSEMTSPAVLGTTVSDTTVDVLPSTTATEAFVARIYADLLGRDPDPGGLAYWTNLIVNGGLSRQSFVLLIATGNEHLGTVVDGLYAQFLGRAPDPAGRAFWIGQLQGGLSQASLVGLLAGSPEFLANAGGTTGGFVDDAYQTILGRAPDSGGRAYWISQVDGGTPRSAVAFALYQSLESRMSRVADLYQLLLHRAPDPAGQAFWANVLLSQSDLALTSALGASDEYYNRVP